MEIKVSTENGRVPITVMHIDGNLDLATYESFQTKAEELIEGGSRYILVDLSHAPFVSSAGLRALNHVYKELSAIHPDSNLGEEELKEGIRAGTYKSPHLKLVNLSNETKMVFKTSGFDMYIEIHDDLKAAVASY